MRRLLPFLRPTALVALLFAVAMVGVRWRGTDRFLADARRASGTVLAVTGDGRATIGFSPDPGREARFTADDAGRVTPGGSVPVAYVEPPGGPLDARLATPHALWAPMWAWVVTALGAALLTVYGRALIEDPSSVIGFKSSRLFGREPRP